MSSYNVVTEASVRAGGAQGREVDRHGGTKIRDRSCAWVGKRPKAQVV